MLKSKVKEKQPSILLVEDNPDVAEALSLLLTLEGFEVHVCHDAQSALVQAKASNPFAAIVDIGLPGGMDGHELGQRLRVSLGPPLRLFALTGHAEDDDRRRASGASFDAYMVKPVNMEQLLIWLKDDAASWGVSGHGLPGAER